MFGGGESGAQASALVITSAPRARPRSSSRANPPGNLSTEKGKSPYTRIYV